MTATEQRVILVDENDIAIGSAEKMTAHRENLCHRAFSVFILRRNPGVEILLQQRAAGKYHSAGLWTNTCCSHPQPGEEVIMAGERRLQEEMGIRAELQSVGSFHYIAHFGNGLVENEIDHVLVGFVAPDIVIRSNPAEVQAFRWIGLDALQNELDESPGRFTPWLEKAFELVVGGI